MQNRYTGDFGDYVKYGLLRHLSKGKRLGVAWYLYPDEDGPDGKKIDYLRDPATWRDLDAELFDSLNDIISQWKSNTGQRSVEQVQNRHLLPGAVFSGELLDTDIPPHASRDRQKWRAEWFDRAMSLLANADCEVVFIDPDNGLCLDETYKPSRQAHWKRLPLREAITLSQGKTAILYHHNTRFKGGHHKEIWHWMNKLPRCTEAFYSNNDGFRTFFVITEDAAIRDRLKEFAAVWEQAGQLISSHDAPRESSVNG